VGVTIVIVAYAVVPPVVRVVSGVSGYNPGTYEPKDEARLNRLDVPARGIGLPPVPFDLVVNVLLVLLVVLVWLALVPPGVSRR
jgi:hypothetical protein